MTLHSIREVVANALLAHRGPEFRDVVCSPEA